MKRHSIVIIPFDYRIIFVRPFSRFDVSNRLSEVPQTFNPISGNNNLTWSERLGVVSWHVPNLA